MSAAPNPVKPKKDLSGLSPYLKRYPSGIVFGLFSVVLMSLLGNLIPLATGVVTDTLRGDPVPFQHSPEQQASGVNPVLGHSLRSPWLSRIIPYYEPSSRHTLAIYCIFIVVCILIKGLLSFHARWVLIGVSRDIEFDIRNDLLKRLLLLEPEFYVRNRTGELMSRATNDLNAVRMVLGPGIMYSATTVVTMILAIAVMVMLSPSLTIWVLLPAPVVAVAVWFFGKTIHDLYEKIQAALATLTAKVQENLSGVRIVRAYAQEEAEIRGFDEPNLEYVSRNIKLIRTWSMFMPSLTAMIGTTFLIVLWQGGHQLLRGQISLGALIAFNGYLAQLVWPMIALGWVTNIFQRGAASMGRLNYILTAQPNIDDRAAKIPVGVTPKGEIEFCNLNFAYPTTLSGSAANGKSSSNGTGKHAVLHDISLSVPAGSTLAIVGPTGSGKTTLAALVARLWEAPEGAVLLDGKPLREWPLATLRRAIGFVPQDTYLFGETVGGNIAFGLSELDEARIREAAEIANLDGDVQEFSEKYETVVGERGITLSGGQKQRTAIARAVARDPRILILDDSLSSVDTQTEERILQKLRGVMEGRTTILISHRTSTVKDADQIVVLVDGGIAECGTHDELLMRGGYYADLYQKQLLEEELERA
ncbi:MAG TPA: ABC transporter ATP-binding protein [Candidatus Dormibacteraeota bacterium]|jgi:ATP-binding cassette subfamily B multidrug efflux pump|nr:ABC transporter ATP-binding protein [Candidatus Dormibacteraeota bacterium]